MSFYELVPFACLFFQNLPGHQTAGIMFVVTLVVYVIIPLRHDIFVNVTSVEERRCRGELVVNKFPLESNPEDEQLCVSLMEVRK